MTLKRNLCRLFGICLALLLAVLACSSNREGQSNGVVSSVADLNALIDTTTRGTAVDYTPLGSPTEAREVADAIIRGTLVDIRPGVRVVEAGSEPDPRLDGMQAGSSYYVSYVIKVIEVLSTNGGVVVPDRIEVQVLANTQASAAQLAKLNTRPEVIAALDLATSGELSGVSLKAGDGSSIDSTFFPYTDLFWLDDGTGPRAPYLSSFEELAPGWGDIDTLADLRNSLQP